jgi:hypothetical protein
MPRNTYEDDSGPTAGVYERTSHCICALLSMTCGPHLSTSSSSSHLHSSSSHACSAGSGSDGCSWEARLPELGGAAAGARRRGGRPWRADLRAWRQRRAEWWGPQAAVPTEIKWCGRRRAWRQRGSRPQGRSSPAAVPAEEPRTDAG